MQSSSLFISTIALVWALGCGGRESGTLGVPSGNGSGANGGASTGTNAVASGSPNGGGSGDTNGGSAGTGTGGSISATTGSATTGDGPCLIVQPSSYDQSCSADKDCVLVGQRATSCDPGCRCGNATVNANAQAQYNKDLARALALAGPGIVCACPPPVATIPYCHAGTCQIEAWMPDAASMPADAPSFDSAGVNMIDAQTGPGANCPSALPQAGGACEGPIDCRYPDTCGPVTLRCAASKSYWAVAQRTQCGGACPVAEPKQGDPCLAGGKCSYTSACGSQDTVFCDGLGTAMRIDYGTCPKCPDQEPAPLTACFGSLSCMYTNSCGGADMASCSASSWTVLRGDCEK
jgi:hypothetical protein